MVYPTFEIESKLWLNGKKYICGLDEVGRGCFAGPVVVGAVIFPKNSSLIEGVADSKLLKPRQRERLAKEIYNKAYCVSIAEVSVTTINRVGIGKATQMAFRKAIKNLPVLPDYILVDAFNIKHINRKKQSAVPKGDRVCASISAASIVAKVYRDSLMRRIHKRFPQYGFAKHKGYGTLSHQLALKKYGLSRLHRTSFNLTKFL